MKCPICNEALAMSNREGIEIDYCPKCRGVWLDRGELDKIIEKSVAQKAPDLKTDSNYREYQHHDKNYKYSKRKKNFLDDLFDF